MATLMRTHLIRPVAKPRVALWLAAVAVLGTLLALLTTAIANNPIPSQDVTVTNWVASQAGQDWGLSLESSHF